MSDNGFDCEIENRWHEQAADAGVKGRDERAVGHELAIRRGQSSAHAAHRTGQRVSVPVPGRPHARLERQQSEPALVDVSDDVP